MAAANLKVWVLRLILCLHLSLVNSALINTGCRKRSVWTKGRGEPIRAFLQSVTQNMETDERNVRLVASFDNGLAAVASALPGKPVRGWKRFGDTGTNDGWVFGAGFSDFGEMSGDDLVYVYDDFAAALRGKFVSGVMVETRRVTVKGFRCSGGIMHIQTTSPKPGTLLFDPASSSGLSTSPTIMDPLEQTNVFVRNSSRLSGGEGLFARRRISRGRTVAFFNGIPRHYRGQSTFLFPNMSRSEVSEALRTHLVLDPQRQFDVTETDVVRYRASLAHKAVYSEEGNVAFEMVKHPRFGQIPCLEATRDIEKGEEILVHHDSKSNSPFVALQYPTVRAPK